MHLYKPFFVIVAMCGIFLLQLNTQILRVVLNDSSSSYEDLLTKLDMTIPEAGRVQSIMLHCTNVYREWPRLTFELTFKSGVYQIII